MIGLRVCRDICEASTKGREEVLENSELELTHEAGERSNKHMVAFNIELGGIGRTQLASKSAAKFFGDESRIEREASYS